MSFLDIDWSKKPKQIDLFLAKPNKTIVSTLVEASQINQSLKLSGVNELTFRIPFKVEIDHVLTNNPNIDLLKDRYYVKAKVGSSEEWYVIRNINDSADDENEFKDVTAYLLPYQMNDKLIRAYSEEGINLSQALIGGIATDSAGATRTVYGALENTAWTLGYVDTDFITKFRSFDMSSVSVLDFVFKVAESYNAVIVWDTIDSKINFYKPESVGINRGFNLSYGKYLKSISRESNSDEMVTRFRPIGYEELNIISQNPTGEPYLEDFSYFMYPFAMSGSVVTKSSYYMSDALCIEILNYNALVLSKESSFSSLLAQKATYRGEINTLQAEKDILDEQLAVIMDQLDIAKSNGASTTTLESQRVSKKAEVDSKQSLITSRNGSIASVDTQLAQIKTDLSITNNFSTATIKERKEFIIEKEWSDENIFDEVVLMTEAKKKFEELKKPSVVINISLVNFFKVVEAQDDHDKINLGDVINISYNDIGINATSKIIEVQINWEDDDISLVIANTKEIETDESKLIKMLYQGSQTSTTVDMNKFKWNNVTSINNKVDDLINNSWSALKNSIVAGVNNTIEISERGILVKNTDPAKSNEYVIIQNSVIAITGDNGNTWKNAITARGIIGDLIIGKLFIGTGLQIDASDASGVKTLTVDANGVTIAGTKLTITGGLPANQLDPAFKNGLISTGTAYNGVVIDSVSGLVITKSDNTIRTVLNATTGFAFQKNISGTWTDQMYYDPSSGSLFVDGVINARQLKLNGVNVLAGSNTINGNYINQIRTDQLVAGSAKIGTALIDNLVVGSNVTMGANATISWSNVTSQPYVPTTSDINSIASTRITSTLVSAPIIEGATIRGGTISSNTSIDVGTDLFVGDNIWLTRGSSGTQKIVSAGTGSITFKSNIMTISHAQQIDLQCSVVTVNGTALSSTAVFG